MFNLQRQCNHCMSCPSQIFCLKWSSAAKKRSRQNFTTIMWDCCGAIYTIKSASPILDCNLLMSSYNANQTFPLRPLSFPDHLIVLYCCYSLCPLSKAWGKKVYLCEKETQSWFSPTSLGFCSYRIFTRSVESEINEKMFITMAQFFILELTADHPVSNVPRKTHFKKWNQFSARVISKKNPLAIFASLCKESFSNT